MAQQGGNPTGPTSIPTASAPIFVPVLIPSGSAVSAVIALGGLVPYYVEVPANFTGSMITLQCARPGNTPTDLYDTEGNEVALIVLVNGTANAITIDQQRKELGSLRSASDVIFRAGSLAAPISQSTDVILLLHCSSSLGS